MPFPRLSFPTVKTPQNVQQQQIESVSLNMKITDPKNPNMGPEKIATKEPSDVDETGVAAVLNTEDIMAQYVDDFHTETIANANESPNINHNGSMEKSMAKPSEAFEKAWTPEKSKPLFTDECDAKNLDEITKPQFGGFLSAGGQKISISDDSLAQVKNLFNEDLKDANEIPKTIFGGFSSSGGQKNSISKQALTQTNDIFNEEHENVDEIPKAQFGGFSSAGGKKINISKESLAQVKNIFNEEPEKVNEIPKALFGGFSSAGGKNIFISKESLAQVKNIFNDEPEKVNEVPTAQFGSFLSAAGGQKISICQESLVQVKNLFNEDPENVHVIPKAQFGGFSSAGGKKISVSDKALAHVKNMFNGDIKEDVVDSNANDEQSVEDFEVSEFEPNNELGLKSSPTSSNTKRPPKPPAFAGFLSAKGDLLAISTDAAEKARKIFKEVDSPPTPPCSSESEIKINGSVSKLNSITNETKKDIFIKPTTQTDLITDQQVSKNKRKLEDIETMSEMPEEKKLCYEDPFEDDFSVDTQALAEVEKMINGNSAIISTISKSKNRHTSCRLVGIPEVSRKVTLSRNQERLKQMEIIKQKKNQEVVPSVEGSLHRKKKTKQFKLRDLQINRDNSVAMTSNVRQTTLDMTSETAADHVFVGRQYFSDEILLNQTSILMGDAAQVILNEACNVDLECITNAFLASPGVNPRKVGIEWVKNHFRWIIWKLASYERRFPEKFSGKLHPNEVLLQLKFRYDQEIDGDSRSALKKIYEKDDVANKCLVLCVANIIHHDMDKVFMELTDGCYSIGCIGKEAFVNAAKNDQITVGTKLITFGAELYNHNQACCPLDAPSPNDPETVEVCLNTKTTNIPLLHISFNATRRAKFSTRLGFFPKSSLPTSFDKLVANGGIASEMTVFIARKYPVVYNDADNPGQAYLNQKMADVIQLQREQNQNLEQIYEEVRSEFEKRERKKNADHKPRTRRRASMDNQLNPKEIAQLIYGKDIHEAIENAPEPGYIESFLKPAQVEALQEFKQVQEEELYMAMKNEVEARIKAIGGQSGHGKLVPLLKVKVVDVVSERSGNLSIWKPNDDLIQGLKEKSVVRIFNMNVGSIRADEVNFKTTKMTRFERINVPSDFDIEPFQRQVIPIEDILEVGFSPKFREIDTLGVVVNIEQEVHRAGFQGVHICDSIMNFVSVQFWGGLKKFGAESMVKVGTVALFSNLQWRNSSSMGKFYQTENAKKMPAIPCLYVTEYSTMSADSKDVDRAKMIKDLTSYVLKSSDFVEQARQQFIQLTLKKPRLLTPTLATPPTPMSSSRFKKHILFDPPFASPSANEINPDENSPAQIQKHRYEEKIAFLDKQITSSLPSIETTPILTRRDPKLRKAFKVPFINRLTD